MRIPGINLNGVMSANEFLTRVNLMKGYRFPEYDTPVKVGQQVAVIGAGNVAMDCRPQQRCVLQMHPRPGRQRRPRRHGEVHIVYRRSRDEVPAREEEFHHAEEEGVICDFLTNPVAILGDEKGTVRAMRCIRMQLGEPDASGRRSPVPDRGLRVRDAGGHGDLRPGHQPEPDRLQRCGRACSARSTAPSWPTRRRAARLKPGVWAGGDVVTGAATVISAMGAGKRAAADIHKFLSDETLFDVG